MFPFKTSLNASTLFPFHLDVEQQVRIAAEAGFDGIELWVKDIEAYQKAGGTLQQLRRVIEGAGIAVVNAIAFFPWADADDATREAGFVQAEREMRMLTEIGCRGVAAPPFGNVESTTLEAMAQHFVRLSELAHSIGIEPYLEFWGRAAKLSRLSEVLFVAAESGLPDVKILLDPFHMYTGGSNITSLTLLRGRSIGVVHVNDYPATPNRETIADRDRVFPGEGVAPTHEFAQVLHDSGYNGFLSLELFIEDFGQKSAPDIAKYGLERITTAYRVEA